MADGLKRGPGGGGRTGGCGGLRAASEAAAGHRRVGGGRYPVGRSWRRRRGVTNKVPVDLGSVKGGKGRTGVGGGAVKPPCSARAAEGGERLVRREEDNDGLNNTGKKNRAPLTFPTRALIKSPAKRPSLITEQLKDDLRFIWDFDTSWYSLCSINLSGFNQG